MPSLRERAIALLDPQHKRALTANDAVRGLWAGVQTATGLRVDEVTSLQVIAVFNAVRILSEGFAQIPLKVYRKQGEDGSRDEARQNPMYNLLHDAPNERMTAFAMREHWMMSLALWGNAYTEIIRNNKGEIDSLWPLNPAYTKPERTPDGRLIYRVKVNSDPSGYVASTTEVTLREDQVFHLRGFSLDGLQGVSPIRQIRENIGLADAYQQFASRFFDADATDFALTTDRVMQQPQLDEMHKEWTENHGGLRNRHRLAIFHGGLQPTKIGMPLDDAQFIEQRAFEREEIFSFFRIPPNFWAADKVSSWGTGIDSMSVGFIKFTLDPWFVRAEQALNLKFLSKNAQGPLFAEFDREGFLRGDFEQRHSVYKIGREGGWYSANDIRRIENLPPIGPQGDIYLIPANFVPADKANAIADKQAAPTPVPVVAAPAKAPEPTPTKAALPVAHQTRTDPSKFVRSYIETLKHRQDTAPQPLEREVMRSGNAFIYAAARAMGATELTWITGDECDECRALDGTTRSFEDKHPPLCDECRCIVLPVAAETRTESVSPVTINNNYSSPPVSLTVEPAQVKIEQAAQEAPTVNVTTPEVVVHVPETIVPAAEVVVNVPEQKQVEQKTPIVNVNVSPTPVTVRNDVKTPEVHVANNIDATPRGDIELEYDETKGRLKKLSRKKS